MCVGRPPSLGPSIISTPRPNSETEVSGVTVGLQKKKKKIPQRHKNIFMRQPVSEVDANTTHKQRKYREVRTEKTQRYIYVSPPYVRTVPIRDVETRYKERLVFPCRDFKFWCTELYTLTAPRLQLPSSRGEKPKAVWVKRLASQGNRSDGRHRGNNRNAGETLRPRATERRK